MSSKNGSHYSLVLDINYKIEKLVQMLLPVRTVLVFISSLVTVALSFLIAFYVRHDFSFFQREAEFIPKVLLLVVVVKMTVFLLFRLYEGMWRYVSITDMSRIFAANLISSIILILAIYFGRAEYAPGFSLNVMVLDFLVCFLVMSGKRILMRIIRESAAKASGHQDVRTIILGKPDGINNLLQLFSASPSKRHIIGVLCDDLQAGQSLRGASVLGKTSSAAKCAKKHNISEMLLLPPYSTPANIRRILNDLERRGKTCELRMIPSYLDIADGEISVSHIKEVEIEDLLGRKPVDLGRKDVEEFVSGKKIMVTGAGGSIGSELCCQLAAYRPERLVLFELSELNLYELSDKLGEAFPGLDIVSVIGDVRSRDDLREAMQKNKINLVFHAAAYKHVPLMEANPAMALKTNVGGTQNVSAVSEECGIERVVVISTDKAVNPSSIMGATKRIAERIVLERAKSVTDFVVVRFGNVLGSSGSVIPRFKKQLAKGGPLTVTSKEVVRYFMSIPEAVDLLLQACAIGNDRDIMVLEMGEQIKIYDMARKLIELSGMEPDVDVEIVITGLRPGEKEYEELLTDEEKVDRTPYERIYVAKKQAVNAPPVVVEDLLNAKDTPTSIKNKLARLIPENKFNEALGNR
ncbi:MAG: polysaccharide biosynthesis protein [Victivallales bacterium]|nr:polysaccharide biosynthesis protein [Victivallales bacterium]